MYALLVQVRGQGHALATLLYGPYASRAEANEARALVRAECGSDAVTVRVVALGKYPGREIQNPTKEGGR
jgi:hypothetical protein